MIERLLPPLYAGRVREALRELRGRSARTAWRVRKIRRDLGAWWHMTPDARAVVRARVSIESAQDFAERAAFEGAMRNDAQRLYEEAAARHGW